MSGTNLERIKVLYVDDEEGNLTAFRTTFRRDFQVFTAHSASEGLEVLRKEDIHVVISDQRMPGMTGVDFLSQVREKYPATMRMLLTGYSDMEAVVSAVNKGRIYAYTTKPWDPNDLRLRIQQAYEVNSLRTERERMLKRYRQVFDVSADPIVIVDETGAIQDANPATEKLLGAPLEALKQIRFTELLEAPGGLVRSLKRNRMGTNFTNVDMTLRAPGGRLIDCILTATYLGKGHAGKALYQAMIKDISDRKQEELRLRKLNHDLDRRVAIRTRQLIDALEDLGSFSYTVAHDLRSPLKNIKALTEHLAEQSAASGMSNEADLARRIQKGSERMIDLVDDLLRFAQTNTRELQRSSIDVKELCEEVVSDLVPDDPGITVQIQMPEGTRMFGDRAMLKVVLNNLVSNAVKFTRTVDAPSITIGHQQEGDDCHLWVRDNGVGFDGSRAEKVFGAFKRLHRADQFEGSGVGLAIVQRVVTKHGGSVWAESALGQGTCIHVKIPLNEPLSDGAPTFQRVA